LPRLAEVPPPLAELVPHFPIQHAAVKILSPGARARYYRAVPGIQPPSYRTLRRRVPIFATGAPPSRATG